MRISVAMTIRKPRPLFRSLKPAAVASLPLLFAVAASPIAMADGIENEFVADIARWNSLGGQIPGAPQDWLMAARTVCDGITGLHEGGWSNQKAIEAQVGSAVDGGWRKRDGFYFVMHTANSFCPQFRTNG